MFAAQGLNAGIFGCPRGQGIDFRLCGVGAGCDRHSRQTQGRIKGFRLQALGLAELLSGSIELGLFDKSVACCDQHPNLLVERQTLQIHDPIAVADSPLLHLGQQLGGTF